MDKRGLAALLHYLMNVDISSVNLRVIPKTTALLETKLLTMSTVDRFWYERLVDGCNVGGAGTWAKEVRCADMHHAFAQFAELSGDRRRAGETELGRALRRLIPGLSDVRRRPHGTKQERNWVFPSLDACRDAFCEALGQPVDWDGQDGIATSPKRGGRK